jgi:hypothetical protein
MSQGALSQSPTPQTTLRDTAKASTAGSSTQQRLSANFGGSAALLISCEAPLQDAPLFVEATALGHS